MWTRPAGIFTPLPRSTFPAGKVADAFRYLAQAKQVGKVVRLQRTNPLDPIKAELLGRLREHYAAGAV